MHAVDITRHQIRAAAAPTISDKCDNSSCRHVSSHVRP
jgi:hypothetical protein